MFFFPSIDQGSFRLLGIQIIICHKIAFLGEEKKWLLFFFFFLSVLTLKKRSVNHAAVLCINRNFSAR